MNVMCCHGSLIHCISLYLRSTLYGFQMCTKPSILVLFWRLDEWYFVLVYGSIFYVVCLPARQYLFSGFSCKCHNGNTCMFFCFQEHYFSRISWRLCVVSATLSVHKVCREATCARNEGGVLLSQVAPGSFQNAALWANLLKISSTGLPACMPEECKGRLMEQEKFKWVFFLFIGPLIKHFDVVLCWAKI